MNFGYLADDCNFSVAECGGEVAERCAYLVRSFVEYHRARLFNYALYVLGAARLVDAQETLKSESSGGHAGYCHRRCECGRSWHGFDFYPVLVAHAHQILAGVGYRGHTGVRDEHAALAVHQPRDYSRAHLESVVLVIAYHRLLYPERVEKLQRHSGVLRGDEIAVFKRIYRAGREVAQIAYRRADNIKYSAHLSVLFLSGSLFSRSRS